MTSLLDPPSEPEVAITTTDQASSAVEEPASALRRLRDNWAARFTLRWVVLLAALVIVFWPTLHALGHQIAGHSPVGYVVAVPFWVALTALGSRRRRGVGLPIHDAETDGIVGGGMLAIAFVGQGLLGPRLDTLYDLWHPDLFALWLAALGLAVLLLGLRPVGRFRGAWGVALLIWPLPYRVIGVALGGTAHVYGGLDALITALVMAGLSRSRRAGAGAAVAGVVAGVLAARYLPGPLLVVQLTPVVVAALAGLLVLLLGDRDHTPVAANPKPAVGAVTRTRWIVIVAVTAAAAVLLPRPPAVLRLSSVTPASTSATTFADQRAWPAPVGWHVVDTTPSTWVRAYYGTDATWERQRVVENVGNPAYDKLSRPRTIMIDTLTADGAQQLADFPVITSYPIAGDRSREPTNVDLGDGVTGQLYDTVDDAKALTFTMLTITWTVHAPTGAHAQRITLISSDDHLANAIFPQPQPSLTLSVRAAVKRILRGDATSLDTNVEPKDAAMLIAAGKALVTTVVDGS